jgi:hypothetical protein
MPTIDSFNGIKIHVYNGEHRPPHIHADYNEFEVLVDIEKGVVFAGDLPTKQLKQVSIGCLGILNGLWKFLRIKS